MLLLLLLLPLNHEKPFLFLRFFRGFGSPRLCLGHGLKMAAGRQFLSDSQRDALATLEVKKANTPKLMTKQDKVQLEAFYRMIAYHASVNCNVSIKAYKRLKTASYGV